MTTRMTEEERKTRREARRLAREAKIAEGVETVEVAEKPTEEKKSLFERMTGSIKTATPKRKTRSKKVDPTIITQVAPLVLSTFLVSFTRQRIPEPYKVCAPTQEEVINMVKPYFNILSRYVEITGHLSENTVDLISAMLASIVYGTRAYVMFVNIQEYTANGNGQHNSTEDSRDTRDFKDETANTGIGFADDNSSDNGHGREDAVLLGTLFKRDIIGRRQLGLL